MLENLKRILVGRPLASAEAEHQRLPKTIALAVFSSDAISSTAYATEEILHVLVPLAAMAALGYLVPISLIVVFMLAIVSMSYRQTVHAYPHGGGSYVVSRENLGRGPSLVAGASLLVDYILTVAVSVSAGVAAIISAIPEVTEHRVTLGLGLVTLITLANLRGIKESGRVFAAPTYIYILALGSLILIGLFRSYTGSLPPLPVDQEALDAFTGGGVIQGVTLFALLRAFSSGAVALTGIEAISDGVPAFRKPAAKNAAATLTWMAIILATFFFGISLLATRLQPTLSEHETVLSTLGTAVFGRGTVMYIVLQASTAAILVLAANTAYADFPRLSSIIARDGFLPRQFATRGDRLVFSNGIVLLAISAAILLVVFGGTTTALIPLYAVGVFTSFTLSQSGMVRHHLRLKEPGWKRGVAISAVGAVATFIVLLIVAVSKFTIGAWVPAVLIPLIVLLFKGIRRHYDRVNKMLHVEPGWKAPRMNHTVIVLVGRVHRGVLEALAYARSLAPNHLAAVSVVTDDEEQRAIEAQWESYEITVPLEMVHSPYRDLVGSIMKYIDDLDDRWQNDIVTVLIPEFVVTHWWEQLLHNQTALFLKARLLFRPNIVVTSVPVHLDIEEDIGQGG